MELGPEPSALGAGLPRHPFLDPIASIRLKPKVKEQNAVKVSGVEPSSSPVGPAALDEPANFPCVLQLMILLFHLHKTMTVAVNFALSH